NPGRASFRRPHENQGLARGGGAKAHARETARFVQAAVNQASVNDSPCAISPILLAFLSDVCFRRFARMALHSRPNSSRLRKGVFLVEQTQELLQKWDARARRLHL